jgi:hypothetical protein
MIIIHDKDYTIIPNFVELIFKKKNVNNIGIKLYNELPSHLKNLKNTQLFRRRLKLFLLQQTFYSLKKCLSYEALTWKIQHILDKLN